MVRVRYFNYGSSRVSQILVDGDAPVELAALPELGSLVQIKNRPGKKFKVRQLFDVRKDLAHVDYDLLVELQR